MTGPARVLEWPAVLAYVASCAAVVLLLWLLAPVLEQVSVGYSQGMCAGRGDVWSTATHTCTPGRRTYEQGVCEGRGGVYDLPAAACRPDAR